MTWTRPPAAAQFLAQCALVAVAGILLAGCADSADEIAAEAGGQQYSVADLHDYLAGPDDEPVVGRVETTEWLSRWVFFAAVEAEMDARGIEVTNEHEALAVEGLTAAGNFVPSDPGADIEIHQSALSIAVSEWSQAEASAGLEIPDSAQLRHLCSSHILVETAEEADSVLERIEGGEDFATLAAELSLDTGSGGLGGELGCVVEGAFVAPFESAAYSVTPGELTTAQTQFGFHVIQVASSGTATQENHPQLDAESLDRLSQKAEQAAQEAYQAQLEFRAGQIIQDFTATMGERVGDDVFINDDYGYWDSETFSVVIEPIEPDEPSEDE